MLWQHYVYRRGADAQDMWERMYSGRAAANKPVRLLYVAGRGFDTRAQLAMDRFVESLRSTGCFVQTAELLLIGFADYQLSEELSEETERNAAALSRRFAELGNTKTETAVFGASATDEADLSATSALRLQAESVLSNIDDQSDVVLDVSSLPRVAYLALLTSILQTLIPNKTIHYPLNAQGITFQVIVAEDARLDSLIRSEDPSNDLVLIPGFSSALQLESVQDWPMVWFPILGENRVSQLEKVISLAPIPASAEICPVVPHPSRNPRRADQLLIEYREPLFASRSTPTTSVLFAHESHPFEAYRQLLGAMRRYRDSMGIIGGCRLVVTPLASKLITLGAGLACFEMRPEQMDQDYGVAIPYAVPTRYLASIPDLRSATPEIVRQLRNVVIVVEIRVWPKPALQFLCDLLHQWPYLSWKGERGCTDRD
jgi:hypothetical protein